MRLFFRVLENLAGWRLIGHVLVTAFADFSGVASLGIDACSYKSALYVGVRKAGTTSQLRSEALVRSLPGCDWTLIDTAVPFAKTGRLWRSMASRLKLGPAIRSVNDYLLVNLPDRKFDLIWIDKGVFLWPSTVQQLRRRVSRLVYYTPDTSFLSNQSRFFEKTIKLYDLVVTTKSLELNEFLRRIEPRRLLLVTQTYDRQLHYPRCRFEDKRREAVLIGLCEPSRERLVRGLLEAGIPVCVGGHGWQRFVHACGFRLPLTYLGPEVFGEMYAEAISRASIGLGMLTQRFPELHTTRTFEIPACGTALATPATVETRSIFQPDEAIFFEDKAELLAKIWALWKDVDELKRISLAGLERVKRGGFDNDSLIVRVLGKLHELDYA